MAQAERYIVDSEGKRVAVLLDIADYERLLAAAEEWEAARAYDEAKARDDEVIPFADAVREIEESHGQ